MLNGDVNAAVIAKIMEFREWAKPYMPPFGLIKINLDHCFQSSMRTCRSNTAMI